MEANDGASALERLDEAAVDVIVCDLNMPGMDGIEFLRHLADRGSHPALILLSGEDKSVLKTATQLGQAHGLRVLGAVPKPVTREPSKRCSRGSAPAPKSGRAPSSRV